MVTLFYINLLFNNITRTHILVFFKWPVTRDSVGFLKRQPLVIILPTVCNHWCQKSIDAPQEKSPTRLIVAWSNNWVLQVRMYASFLYQTRMSVFVIHGQKCMLAMSLAAPGELCWCWVCAAHSIYLRLE